MLAIEQTLSAIRVGDTHGAWTVTEVRSQVSPWSGNTLYEIDLRCACGQTERTRNEFPVFTSRHCNRCRTGDTLRKCAQCVHNVYTNDPHFKLCSTCQRRNTARYCVACDDQIYSLVRSSEVCQHCTDGDRRYTCPLCNGHWTVKSYGRGGICNDQLCQFCKNELGNELGNEILEFLANIAGHLNLALAA